MYLIIQIPCLNEEETLSSVIQGIPKQIDGINRIELQIIDDGSSDNTIEVAKSLDVNHILKNIGNKGLGNSFRIGMENAINLGADILINTDGDNQYPSKYIPDLIKPILEKESDIVIGDRQTSTIKHFSPIKKFLQYLGTSMTKILSGSNAVADAVSGFRAYSRNAMLEINVTAQFSYVLDTTIQASNKRIKTVSVPIITNSPTRPSRLFKNIFQHVRKSTINLLRTFAFYKPLRLFFGVGTVLLIIGIIPMIRFLYDYFFISGSGKIQSLVIGGIVLSMSFNCFALGVIGDLMSRNRTLIEQILKMIKQKNH